MFSASIRGRGKTILEKNIEGKKYWNEKYRKPTPSADWIKILKEDHTVELKQLAEYLNMSTTKLKEVVNKKLMKEFKQVQVLIRVPEKKIESLLQSGRFKTFFETHTSQGMKNVQIRKDIERKLFGYESRMDVTNRPVYGMINNGKNLNNIEAENYGSIIVKLKPKIKSRTTFVNGDSIHETAEGYVGTFTPEPLLKPTYKSVNFTFGLETVHDTPKQLLDYVIKHRVKIHGDGYTEAQIHGGVTLSDVQTIYFKNSPNKGITEFLNENKIKWELY